MRTVATGRKALSSLTLACIMTVLVVHERAAADDAPSDLEQTVADQARRIEELEATLRAVLERLDKSDLESAEAKPEAEVDGDTGEAVDRAYVDERIQDFEDSAASRFMVSGYGTTGLVYRDGREEDSTAFRASFNPGFHFRMTDKLHFTAELEMEFEVDDQRDVDFEIGLEFAQFDYLATDWLVISGGRFLTPFNTFGPRLHPTWINKLSSPPPIYGGGHGSGGFIPVLKTLGAMGSGGRALWNDDAKINYALYVGNGPTGEDLSVPPDQDELLDLEFNNLPDLDDGVQLGGRFGFLPIGNLEFGVSYMTSDPDDVRFHLIGLDAWYFYEGLELRGEFAYLMRDTKQVKANVQGYWLQAAYRLSRVFPERSGIRGVANRLEPVIRWGQVLDSPEKNRDQLALGLNYWLFESVPFKITYEFNDGDVADNRLIVDFAYGF